ETNVDVEPMGHVGVVAGATIRPGELDFSRLNGPILAPGLGAQGATVQTLQEVFGEALSNVLPASSRDILRHGPAVSDLRAAVRRVGTKWRAWSTTERQNEGAFADATGKGPFSSSVVCFRECGCESPVR